MYICYIKSAAITRREKSKSATMTHIEIMHENRLINTTAQLKEKILFEGFENEIQISGLNKIGQCHFKSASGGRDGLFYDSGVIAVYKDAEGLFTLGRVQVHDTSKHGALDEKGFRAKWWNAIIRVPFENRQIGDPNSCANPRFYRSALFTDEA